MNSDQFVYVSDDDGAEAKVDGESVPVTVSRLGKQFSQVESEFLSVHVGVMSAIGGESDFTVRVVVKPSPSFVINPANIRMAVESRSQTGERANHSLQVADDFPWRQQGPAGNKDHIWWAHFKAVPVLKSSVHDSLRFQIVLVLEDADGNQKEVEYILELKKDVFTVPA